MNDVEIISEIGSIHDGSFGNAMCAIKTSKLIGCDTVKFQMHIAEEETTRYAKSPAYFKSEDRFSYFNRTSFTLEQWSELFEEAKKLGIKFLVSPFSIKAVDLLVSLGIKYFKVASGEVTNLPLLERLNQPDFDVILSSGMSDWVELKKAAESLNGVRQLTVLQCTSEYPCPLNKIGLNILPEIRERIPVHRVGLSDHSDGFSAAIGAVYYGASVIEKHFSFSRFMYGSDARFGQTPEEMTKLVQYIREAQQLADSTVHKEIDPNLKDMKAIFEKSIVAKQRLLAGDVLTNNMIALKKPGDGLPARLIDQVIGKKLRVNMEVDEQITWEKICD